MINQSFLVIDVNIMQEARLSIFSRAYDGKLLSTTVANHVKDPVLICSLCIILQPFVLDGANGGGCVTVEGMQTVTAADLCRAPALKSSGLLPVDRCGIPGYLGVSHRTLHAGYALLKDTV